MIRSRKMWFGLGISILLLGLFLTTAGLGRMLDALGDANYLYVIPAVGLYLVSVLIDPDCISPGSSESAKFSGRHTNP